MEHLCGNFEVGNSQNETSYPENITVIEDKSQ